ncbi:MAG: Ig-like domain-containing protein [Bacteroidaceae bacterium]|nr:Ig-like domain-containing protein [Bacteroidaceae bacterium]
MKKICLLCLMLSISLWANAQATSLTVDNQTPGWLSSKINYGDQQTVKNLKVTGYINKTDLKFIGTLISSGSLDGEIDLSNANILSETSGGEDSVLVGFGLSKMDSIRVYRIPQSASSVVNCINNLYVDTMYFDCEMTYVDKNCLSGKQTQIGYLFIGENTDSIPEMAFNGPVTQYGEPQKDVFNVETVHFPTTIRYIGDQAFPTISSCNFNDLKQLEYLGMNAFSHYEFIKNLVGCYYPDTLVISQKLNNPLYLFAFAYKDGQHIFIGDNITEVSGYSQLWGKPGDYSTSAKLHFHINSMIPPSIVHYKFSNSDVDLTTSYVYVPKGAKEAYLKSSWKNATIIEANPIETITLNKHEVTINKGTKELLSTTISPIDADNKTIIWNSSNEIVATVNEKGLVTALQAGEAWIKVVSTDNPEAKDSCKVTVIQPVTGISLSQEGYTLDRIGASYQLKAFVEPKDASNKEIAWKSYNESVCIVNNGLVIATGYGTTIVTATTDDGGFMDYCTIIVEDNTPVSGIDADGQAYKVFDMKGILRSRLVKGLNIIRFSDGTMKKVVIK